MSRFAWQLPTPYLIQFVLTKLCPELSLPLALAKLSGCWRGLCVLSFHLDSYLTETAESLPHSKAFVGRVWKALLAILYVHCLSCPQRFCFARFDLAGLLVGVLPVTSLTPWPGLNRNPGHLPLFPFLPHPRLRRFFCWNGGEGNKLFLSQT